MNTPNLNVARRTFLAGGAALSASVSLCGCEAVARKDEEFSITVLNPDCMEGGVGLCVVIRTPAGKTYLFDTCCGDFRGKKRKNNGKDIVHPWLVAHGIRTIDGLVISHYHADHFGGFLWLYDHFPIRKVFDNSFVPTGGGPLGYHYAEELEAAKKALASWEDKHPGMLVSNTRAGTDLGWDEPGVSFEVVWPPHDHYCEAISDFKKASASDLPFHHLLNANSTAIRVKVGERIFFIGGDNSSRQYLEKYMLPYYCAHGMWGADAIVIPGHGDPEIWDHVKEMSPRPQYAVASQGNLPWMMERGRQVLANYVDKAGIRNTYCTNIHGDVTLALTGGTIRVRCNSEKLYPHDPS